MRTTKGLVAYCIELVTKTVHAPTDVLGRDTDCLTVLRFGGAISYAERNVHRWYYRRSFFKMPRLVIKKYMRLHHLKDFQFLYSTEEKRIVWHDSPTLKSVDGPFVRRSISRCDKRYSETVDVGRIGPPLGFLRRLDLRHANQEFL